MTTSKRERFRLLDETGLSVAEVDCPDVKTAASEILHYYLMYQQDGKHTLQQKIGRKWVDWIVNFQAPK